MECMAGEEADVERKHRELFSKATDDLKAMQEKEK